MNAKRVERDRLQWHTAIVAKTLTIGVLLLTSLSTGCSKKKLDELADKVQKQSENLVNESKKMTDSLVETAKEQLPETGKMTIKTSEPVEFDQAVVTMHVVGDGRMNSLQITTYPVGSEYASSPACFLHATTEIETVALLAGKSVACNLFLEANSNSPIARTPVGKPVSVTFGSMNMQEKTITATIDSCSLIGSDDKPVAVAGGEVLAVVEGT